MPTRWEAVYDDDTSLCQYNDDGTENLFKDINLKKLFEFRIIHNNRVISLFMPSGTFGINGLLYNTNISNKDVEYRLIYFVRRRKILGNGKDTNKYFVGFQITEDRRNKKRMLSICENEISFLNE